MELRKSSPHLAIFLFIAILIQITLSQVPVSYQNPCFYADSVSAAGASALGTLTVPFANHYSINNTNYNIYRGIVNFEYSPSSSSLNFFISVASKSFTSVSFLISSTFSGAVSRYTLRYMVIDISNFAGSVFFTDYNFTNFSLSPSNPVFQDRVNPPGGNIFQTGNTPATYCTLVMIDMVDVTNSNSLGVNMECQPYNPAIYEVTFRYVHNATYNLIGVNVMIFDKTFVELTLDVTIERQYFPFEKNATVNYVTGSGFALQMEQYSSFLGLSGFNSINQAVMRFDSLLDYANQEVSVFNSSNTAEFFFYFNYFNINDNTLGCPFNYPYQLGVTSNGTCYSTIPLGYFLNTTTNLLQSSFCPDGQFINATDVQCYPCLVTCLTCVSADNCTTCDGNNSREFNNVTEQCDPITGYYETGQPQTLPCSIACLSCTDAVTCLDCDNSTNRQLVNGSCVALPGYYTLPNVTTALICSSFCLTCSGAADNCTSCNSSNNRELNTSSFTCDPMSGYYETGQPEAFPCSIACVSCTDNLTCLQCDNSTNRVLDNGFCVPSPGFYESNSSISALPCDSSCQTCQNDSFTCTSCFNTSILTNSSCVQCSSLFDNCSTCTALSCLTCNNNLVLNVSNYCSECSTNCLACSILDTNCTSCISGDFLDNNVCYPCQYPCSTCNSSTYCLTCLNNSNQWQGSCIFCAQNQYFVNGSCVLCSLNLSSCLSCENESVCLSCADGTYLDNITSTCISCNTSIPNCVLCDSSTNCSSCVSSYTFDVLSFQCVSNQCGDGIVSNGQECDDGNGVSQDGCFNCYVETDWNCSHSPSVCEYIGQLDLTLQTVVKEEGKNSIQVVFNVEKGQNIDSVIESLNFNEVLKINDGQNATTIASYQYNPADNTISLVIDYTQTIQNTQITLTFDPALSNHTAFFKKNASFIAFQVAPQNNLLANHYDQSDYQLANITEFLTIATACLFLLLFSAAVLTGKVIGVEAAAVAQFAFISLMCLKNMSPTYASLKKGLIVCIYYPFGSESSLNVEASDYLRGLDLSPEMVDNFIIDFCLILLPLFIGLTLLILSKTALKEKNTQLGPWRSKFLFELTFHMLFFSSYFGFSSVLVHYFHLSSSLKSSSGFMGLIIGIIFLVLVITYTIFFIKRKPEFGEYESFFSRERGMIYILMMLQRAILGIMVPVCASQELRYAQIIFIVVFIFFGIGILIRKPYLEHSQSYRQAVNYSIAIGVQVVYLIPTFVTDSESKLLIYAPLVVIVLLLVCFIFNFVMLVKEMCRKKQQKKDEQVQQNKNNENNELQRTRTQTDILDSSRMVPLMGQKQSVKTFHFDLNPIQIVEATTPEAMVRATGLNPLQEVSEEFNQDSMYKKIKEKLIMEQSSFQCPSPTFGRAIQNIQMKFLNEEDGI